MHKYFISYLFLFVLACCGGPVVYAQTFIKGPALIEGTVETVTAAGTTTLTKDSQTNQIFTGSATETVVLPDATTLPEGRRFYIANRSSLSIDIEDNAAGAVKTLLANTQATIILTDNSTAAGSWDVENIIADASQLVGILEVDNGGTGLDGSTAPNGSVLIGNGTGYTLDTIDATTNQTTVTNGAGSIQIGTVQDIATTSSPTFASPTITGDITLSNAAFDSEKVGDSLAQLYSTGVRSGAAMSINLGDNTKFDVALGIGYIVNYSTPSASTIDRIAIGPFTAQTVTNLASADFTWVMIDSTGAIVQQTAVPNATQRRTHIVLGRLNHSNRTNISFANTLPDFVFSPVSQLGDLMDSLGSFNISGNVITANGANLSLNKSAGVMFQKNFNYTTSTTNPSEIATPGLTPVTFAYQNQSGGPGANVTVIDPTTYDVGGVTTTVPNPPTTATVQRVYLFGSNSVRIQRGQATYANLATALQNFPNEAFVVSPLVEGFGVLIAYIAVEKGCLDLSTNTCSRIIAAGKFGSTASGGGGTTTLQQSYLNSVQPQIVLNSTQLGMQIRDNGTPIGSTLFAIQNNAGSTNYLGVDVNGVSTTNFVGTGTAGAVRVHNLTTTQKNALTPAAGMVVYDTDLSRMQCYVAGSWGDCSSEYYNTDLTLTASDTLAIVTNVARQTWLVQGNSGAVTMSTTPFGSSAPINGAEITLIGNNNTNTVQFVTNDAAKGIIGYGFTLGLGQVVTLKYNSTLDRYVIKSTSN